MGAVICFNVTKSLCITKQKLPKRTKGVQTVIYLLTIHDTPILISYKKIKGNAIIIIETGSGGVIKDDKMRITIIACRR